MFIKEKIKIKALTICMIVYLLWISVRAFFFYLIWTQKLAFRCSSSLFIWFFVWNCTRLILYLCNIMKILGIWKKNVCMQKISFRGWKKMKPEMRQRNIYVLLFLVCVYVLERFNCVLPSHDRIKYNILVQIGTDFDIFRQTKILNLSYLLEITQTIA